MTTPAVRCEGLVVGRGGQPILPPIDVTLERGRFTVILGPNGAGKSTWLETIAGVLPPVRGRVVRGDGLRASYVPQAAHLDPLLPVRGRELVRWGRLRGWDFLKPFASAADRRAADEALATTGAAPFASRPFRALSGGQKQRVLLARLLASGADLALLDEPTASMDVVAARSTYAELGRLAHDRGVAVVAITHDEEAARMHADDVLRVDAVAGVSRG